jgi:hypothetical protein
VIKKWLTVVAVSLAVAAIALLPGKAGTPDAGAEPACGLTAVCWGEH